MFGFEKNVSTQEQSNFLHSEGVQKYLHQIAFRALNDTRVQFASQAGLEEIGITDSDISTHVGIALGALERKNLSTEQFRDLSAAELARRVDFTRLAQSVFSRPEVTKSPQGLHAALVYFDKISELIDAGREHLHSETVDTAAFWSTIDTEGLRNEARTVVADAFARLLAVQLEEAENTTVDLDQTVILSEEQAAHTTYKNMLADIAALGSESDAWLAEQMKQLEKAGLITFTLQP